MTVWLLSFSIGLLLGVLVWTVYCVFRDVPVQDRAYLDRPPAGFRVVWPFIQTLVHYCGHWLPAGYRTAIDFRLKRAGVEYRISAAQFFFGKLLSALACGVALYLFLSFHAWAALLPALFAATGGYVFPELWLKETATRRANAVFRSLPFYLDVITLAVEAGSNLTGGITQAVQNSPEGPLRSEFSRVLRDIRAGKTRAESLRELAERSAGSAVNTVVSSMIQAERAGASLGPVLRAQSEQLRTERFQKAEKLAMQAPVKLLGPLVLCIFPTTFLVIGFVILGKALQAHIITWPPLLWAYHWPG